ncbi:hypothetical protein TNCV_5058431 [Trichonephila clavipes]|nr:hypothetical protein TNCV_5058431 [Trichonephila clavipes]
MQEKGGNCLMPDPDYMVDALKLSNQAPRVSGKSLQMCVAWRCPDGTQHLFCWPILLLVDATTTNMPVNLDYFCDFINIFDDGCRATLKSKIPERNQ